MSRKLLFIGVILLLLITAAATPFSVRAEGDPPPNPEPVKPPWITGVNPNVSRSTDKSGEITPAGIAELAAGLEVPLLTAPPDYVDLEPQGTLDSLPNVASLAVPQRYQDPLDQTCGAAALGMALEFLSLNGEGNSPSQATLVNDLKKTGLLYETGTGVEELAFLARQHGYQGTSAFHDWTFDKLGEQLSAGKPVVASLGSNGADQAGHFVILTGISADSKWVSYNDPILGKQTIGTETFQELWDLQGNSGLVARKEPLSAVDDPMLPWMGLLGAVSTLSVLAKYYPLGSYFKNLLAALRGALGNPDRKGLGGKLVPVYEWQEVQDGTKVVQDTSKKIYEYGTRMVQKGVKTVTDTSKRIYEYGTRMVQKGVKTVTNYSKKIYEYGTRMVQKGWKTVKNYGKKIYEYGTRWVTKGWKKITSWVKGIWGWFKKTKWVPKKVKEKFVKGWHYATKTVPKMVKETFVKGWHYATKTVPNMVKETFVKGWHYATKTVPNMVKETFVKGWHYDTKKVPKYVMKKVQVGWKEEQPAVPIDDDTEGEKPEVIPPGYTLEQWKALPYSLQKILLDAYYAQLQENEEISDEVGSETSLGIQRSDLNDLLPNWLMTDFKPPEFEAIPNSVWDDLTLSEKITLYLGQDQETTKLTLLPDSGVNLRSSPEVGDNLKFSVEEGWLALWDGKVEVDSEGRIWLHVNIPGGDNGWMAWREADGEKYLELTPEPDLSNYFVNCETDNLCTDWEEDAGWGDNYQVGSASQFRDVRGMLEDSGWQGDTSLYPKEHNNLCGVLTTAKMAGIPLEQAILIYRDIFERGGRSQEDIENGEDRKYSDALKNNEAYGYQPMAEFFHTLGYATSTYHFGNKSTIDNILDDGSGGVVVTDQNGQSENIDGIMVGVDINGATGELVPRSLDPEEPNPGHWVELVEYNDEMVTIYNHFTDQTQHFSTEVFNASWWGDALQIKK